MAYIQKRFICEDIFILFRFTQALCDYTYKGSSKEILVLEWMEQIMISLVESRELQVLFGYSLNLHPLLMENAKFMHLSSLENVGIQGSQRIIFGFIGKVLCLYQ